MATADSAGAARPAGRRALEDRLLRAWRGRGALACALWPLSLVYRAVLALRALLYRVGAIESPPLPLPVLVVGNLIAGGAGKTPAVIAVIGLLRAAGYTPAVISRGHGGAADDVLEVAPDTPAAASGDEPLLLRRRLGVPVVVGRNRVAAVQRLAQCHPAVDIVVSDDGLQHRRLRRCAQVIVFDERGAGNGWVLPAGPLREPMPRRPPERSVVLYNAPAPTTAWPGHRTERRLQGVLPLADWWAGAEVDAVSFERLRGRRVVAAAGIAQPQRFFDALQATGIDLQPLPLPDHAGFEPPPWPHDTADVVVTEKDAVKLDPARRGGPRIWVAPLDSRPDDDFGPALLRWLPPPRRPPPERSTDGQPTA